MSCEVQIIDLADTFVKNGVYKWAILRLLSTLAVCMSNFTIRQQGMYILMMTHRTLRVFCVSSGHAALRTSHEHVIEQRRRLRSPHDDYVTGSSLDE